MLRGNMGSLFYGDVSVMFVICPFKFHCTHAVSLKSKTDFFFIFFFIKQEVWNRKPILVKAIQVPKTIVNV